MNDYEIKDEQLEELIQLQEIGYWTNKMHNRAQILKRKLDKRLK